MNRCKFYKPGEPVPLVIRCRRKMYSDFYGRHSDGTNFTRAKLMTVAQAGAYAAKMGYHPRKPA